MVYNSVRKFPGIPPAEETADVPTDSLVPRLSGLVRMRRWRRRFDQPPVLGGSRCLVLDFHDHLPANHDARRDTLPNRPSRLGGLVLRPAHHGCDSRNALLLGHQSRVVRRHMDRGHRDTRGNSVGRRIHHPSTTSRLGIVPHRKSPTRTGSVWDFFILISTLLP